MRFGFVSANILDLRRSPDMHSERVHQTLFGSPVRVLDESGAYVLVEDPIGYRGWGHQGGLAVIDRSQFSAARAGRLGVVRALQARLHKVDGTIAGPPHIVYYGTIVMLKGVAGSMVTIATPDGTRYAIKQAQIAPINGKRDRVPTGAALVREARRFLGAPYLWGGVSTPGFDCSGLVHTICARFGISVPRDTADQIGAGRHVERDDVRTGDLLFFDRHVGFAAGRRRLIHSSLAGQGVREQSLSPDDADYRSDLDRTYREARRII